jgi:hypothetical protein
MSPKFYRTIIKVPDEVSFTTIYIPYSIPPNGGRIYLAGVVLAAGEYSDTSPRFMDQSGTQGNWGGQEFQNLIRNGLAEQAGFRLRPWVGNKFRNVSVSGMIDPPLIVATSLDWRGMGWYYQSTLQTLFRTFWASLAGDKSWIPGRYANYYIMVLTIFGITGTGIMIVRKRKNLRWDILFILGLFFFIPWGLAMIRGMSGFVTQNPLYTWARYADPGILSSGLLLCAGWLEWINLIKTRFISKNAVTSAVFLGGMVGISALALNDAIQDFHSAWLKNWDSSLAFLLIAQAIAIGIIMYMYARFRSQSSK